MPKAGDQTWVFSHPPELIATGTVAGKTEAQGPIGSYFDQSYQDDRVGEPSWERAEQRFISDAVNTVLHKADLRSEQVDLLVGADLNAQLTGFYFGTRAFPSPILGVYSACASVCEALAIAGMAIDGGYAHSAIAGTSSHNSTAERQFRYPTEYAAQKPPTAQRTVTGAGVALLAREAGLVKLTSATIGNVVDFGVKSPWEMGAAMAPAARATILAHLRDTGRTVADYDCIATGDLGRVGHSILRDLLERDGIEMGQRLTDCGMLIYSESQPEVFSGGSGGACCSLVMFAHLLPQLVAGSWQRILVCATGALLSGISTQQGDTIPSVAHAVVWERKE